MKLTKEQRDLLKSLKSHPWFKVLELLEEEAKNELWKKLLSSNLDDATHLEVIKKNQIYMKARSDFFANIDKHTREVYDPSV